MVRRKQNLRNKIGIIFLIGLIFLTLPGCLGQSSPTTTPSPQISPSPTEYLVTSTPTPIPLGSPGNPLVMGIVSELNDPQISASSSILVKKISEQTGYTLTSRVFSTYKDLVKELEMGKIHITWLPPLTYLYARKKGVADIVLLSNRFGVYFYGSQILANVGSGFTPYFDAAKGQNITDSAVALRQFLNRRPCWVEPQSASGYILAASLLSKNRVSTLDPAFVQSHTAVIRALYVKGICDFGVTFSISGDPRTSSAVTQDLPDVMQRIIVIWRTDPVIPNISLNFIPGMQAQMRRDLVNAYLDQAKSAEGRNLLTASTGGLQIDDMKIFDDSAYDNLRIAVEELKLDLAPMIGK